MQARRDSGDMMQPADDLRLAISTLPDEETAERLAAELLDLRLIACANLVPGLRSLFHWQGEVSRESEVLMIMKAPSSRLEALAAQIDQSHPYDVPEFLVLPLESGLAAYCEWVREETREVSG